MSGWDFAGFFHDKVKGTKTGVFFLYFKGLKGSGHGIISSLDQQLHQCHKTTQCLGYSNGSYT